VKRAMKIVPRERPADRDVRHVLDAIRRIVRVLRKASREAQKRVGLTAAQLFVLQKLAEATILSVNDLSQRTHTHQSSVSVVVQRLVDHGLVARTRSAKDGRQAEVSVTRAGRAALRSAPTAAQEQIVDALNDMPAVRLRELSRSLDLLLKSLGVDGSEPAGMLFEEERVPAASRPVRGGASRRR